MFSGCKSLTSLDLSSFDTSNVVDMGAVFQDCSNLTTIFIGSHWTTENARTTYMFNRCGTSTLTPKS